MMPAAIASAVVWIEKRAGREVERHGVDREVAPREILDRG